MDKNILLTRHGFCEIIGYHFQEQHDQKRRLIINEHHCCKAKDEFIMHREHIGYLGNTKKLINKMKDLMQFKLYGTKYQKKMTRNAS